VKYNVFFGLLVVSNVTEPSTEQIYRGLLLSKNKNKIFFLTNRALLRRTTPRWRE